MRRLVVQGVAEFIGTALLVCVVVGSGIMGTALSGDLGVALTINTFSTIFALALLILVIDPISGAHFNPVVSLVQFFGHKLTGAGLAIFSVAQVAGAIVGSIVANLMFNETAVSISTHERVSPGTLLGEVIATAGLIIVIGVLSDRGQVALIPFAVALWIGSAYAFTSSTSFANPAVTIGRIFSDSFAGIAPGSVLPFISAQLFGAGVGVLAVRAVRSATSLVASNKSESKG